MIIIIVMQYTTLLYGYNSTRALIGCWEGKIFMWWLGIMKVVKFALDLDIIKTKIVSNVVKETVSSGFDRIDRIVSVQWTWPRMNSCMPKRMWKITPSIFIILFFKNNTKKAI